MNDLAPRLREVLGYDFRAQSLLLTALTHRSFSKTNNERLEYLGDAVLGLFIAEQLFRKFPQAAESELTRLRASLVNREALARLARELDLGSHIRLGKGERKSGGQEKESLLSDAMEALLGAIYLDSDFLTCHRVLLKLYGPLLDGLTLETVEKDPKTELQERMQAQGKPLPCYHVIATAGEAHDRLFTVACQVEGLDEPVSATGKSKKIAEQNAAQLALSQFGLRGTPE